MNSNQLHHPKLNNVVRSWYREADATLQSARDASRGVREFLADLGVPQDEQSVWELLVSEAANNCAVHSSGEKLNRWDVLVTVTPNQIMLRLGDRGAGFDWPAHSMLPADDSESGRGLYLIDTLADSRHYTRGKHRNILELTRRLQPPLVMEDQDETLQAMTEELSSCYESLSSIFRFISEARHVNTLESFASRLLDHLTLCTSSDFGMLRVVSGSQLVTCALSGVEEFAPLPIEIQSSKDLLDRWFGGPLDGFPWRQPLCGIVHPFHHHDEVLGVILLGRKDESSPFNAGEENMIRTFAEFFAQHLLGLRHEQAALEFRLAQQEFELAAQIQRSLLPPEQDPIRGVVAAGSCESSLSVGGDFYDLIPIPDRGFFFVLGDVMGKGVAASMMAAVTRSAVRSHSEVFLQPSELLRRVSMQLYDDLNRLEMFVTLVVGVVDQQDGVLRVANAGHCPVMVAHDGAAIRLDPENPPVGIEARPCYPELTIRLEQASRILVFSDGLVDPRNQRRSFADENDLSRWWASTAAHARNAHQLKELLLNRLEYENKSALIADDQTFIVIFCKHEIT